MFEIHKPASALAHGILRSAAGEKRTMEHCKLHFPGVIRNGDGEEAGILVVHMDEIDAAIRLEGSQPNPLPME